MREQCKKSGCQSSARLRPPARKDEHGGRADAGEKLRKSNFSLHKRSAASAKGTACKSAIFGRHLNLFPGYVEIRTQNKKIVPGKSSCIKRGKITEFSNKSANNYRKMVAGFRGVNTLPFGRISHSAILRCSGKTQKGKGRIEHGGNARLQKEGEDKISAALADLTGKNGNRERAAC